MEKFITDERTGLKYELVGDYYLIAGDDEAKWEPIGIRGQRHERFLRENKPAIYSGLLLSGKLDSYLRDIDRQAEQLFSRLVSQMAVNEGVTEELKASDQMAWIQRMNSIRARAEEIVRSELIYPN